MWVAQELSLVGWFRLMMDYNKLRVDQGKTEKWDSEQTRDWHLSALPLYVLIHDSCILESKLNINPAF